MNWPICGPPAIPLNRFLRRNHNLQSTGRNCLQVCGIFQVFPTPDLFCGKLGMIMTAAVKGPVIDAAALPSGISRSLHTGIKTPATNAIISKHFPLPAEDRNVDHDPDSHNPCQSLSVSVMTLRKDKLGWPAEAVRRKFSMPAMIADNEDRYFISECCSGFCPYALGG